MLHWKVGVVDRKELRREREVLRNLLRQVRLEAGLRQEDVAARLGLPQSFVSKYESGERRLDVLELRRVCLAIGTTLPLVVDRLENALRRELE